MNDGEAGHVTQVENTCITGFDGLRNCPQTKVPATTT